MSLMEKMRGGTDSFLLQAVFAIIVVSFIGWGLGNDGPKTSEVANVDGERITSSQLERTMQWVGRGATTDAEYASLQQQVLSGLIEQRVLLNEAERLGIEVSGEEVEYTIQRMDGPTFGLIIVPNPDDILAAVNGMVPKGEMLFVEEKVYKKAKLDRFLASRGMDERVFREEVYKYLKVRKVLELGSLAVHVPPQDVKRAYIEDNTSLTLSWVGLPTGAFVSDVPVTDTELQALLASAPERVQASYDAQFERRFKQPAKARVRMILLKADIGGMDEDATRARLDSILAEIDAGLPFEQAARKYSEDLNAVDGGDLGEQTSQQMEPAVSEAIFGTEAGQRTDIVRTNRGFAVFLVETSTPASEQSFDEVKELVAKEILQKDRAPAFAQEFADQVLASWKATGQAPMDMLAPKLLMPNTAADLKLNATQIPQLGPADQLLAEASKAPAGEVLPEVYTVGGTLVVAQVTSRQDADMSAFDTEKVELERQMTLFLRQSFQQQWSDDLQAQAKIERYLGASAQ